GERQRQRRQHSASLRLAPFHRTPTLTRAAAHDDADASAVVGFGLDTIEQVDEAHDLVEVRAKGGVDGLGKALASQLHADQLAHGGKLGVEVALELVKHLQVPGMALAGLQTDEVAHDDQKRLHGVQHQQLEASAVRPDFRVQRAQAQQLSACLM